MKHLTRAELLDAIEVPAQLPAVQAEHLRQCARCRSEADALGAIVTRAAGERVPEPSPLFWDHFSARVAEAVRSDSISPESAAWFGRLRRPLTTWAVAGAATVLVILSVVWRATVHAPTVRRAAPPVVIARSTVALPPIVADNVDADERWAVVRVAAEDLAWEDVQEAGIAASPGAAEDVALRLTADERSELARLLDQELKRNGV
jgi:hypothetical protein